MVQAKLSNLSEGNSDPSALTVGQIERSLSHKIGAFYREQLGHKSDKVTCKLLEAKLTIIIEGSVTKPEKMLAQEGKGDLVEEVREDLEEAVVAQLKDLIQKLLRVSVIDCLIDSSLETERSGLIVILDKAPEVRLKRNKRS